MATKKQSRAAKANPVKSQARNVADTIKGAPKMAEERVMTLIESSKPAIERAQALASRAGRNIRKQADAIREDLASRASTIGTRVDKERKNLGKRVDGAVKATLASLNIPTRSEINLLTKRVEELSKKIDRLKKK
jgi:poly(hydroxyalkanoate) granule-associated protein